jgi:hypothetical protein
MKQILPIITLTTLAAAASAQSSAAAPVLDYNRVGLTYAFNNAKDFTLSGSALLGSTNFLLAGSTNIGGSSSVAGVHNGADSVSLGYVFKNVVAGIDATLSIGSNENYGLNLRRELGYNVEIAAGYNREHTGVGSHLDAFNVELAYNFTKNYQIALGYNNGSVATPSNSTTSVTLRYNF